MKNFALTFLAAAGLIFTGCENPNGTVNHTGTGALIGAGGGAALGALLGGRHAGEAALIGGAFGAATGAIVGNAMDQDERARLRAQAPQTYRRIEQAQPLYPNDIKAMVASGVPEDVIISQIRTTRSIYHLSAPDIIDLHNAGVSQNVINFMINTANGPQATLARSRHRTTAATAIRDHLRCARPRLRLGRRRMGLARPLGLGTWPLAPRSSSRSSLGRWRLGPWRSWLVPSRRPLALLISEERDRVMSARAAFLDWGIAKRLGLLL